MTIDRKRGDLFLMAVGESFFNQVMPNLSVDMGLCLTAVHWLSEG